MDEFAQSRGDDDLFSDDFEPAAAPTLLEDTPANARPNVSHDVRIGGAQMRGLIGDSHYRGQDRRPGGQRGRGNGRNKMQGPNIPVSGGLAGSRYATQAPAAPENANSRQQVPAVSSMPDSTPKSESIPSDPNAPVTATESQAPQIEQPPPSPQPVPQRTTAVRGDRSATGGPAHKKLTEEELSEKMAKMAIINAQKAERFRLSEADSAAFQQKEVDMKMKRVEEQKNARAMDMERAKNRERKLKAQGGREWDSEKVEADIVDRTRGRTSEYVRGGHGGAMRGDFAGRGFSSVEDDDGGEKRPSRGRGGFEIRGRGAGNRGRGGGGRGGKAAPPVLQSSEEFPYLPKVTAELVKSPPPVGEWADEMATPVDC